MLQAKYKFGDKVVTKWNRVGVVVKVFKKTKWCYYDIIFEDADTLETDWDQVGYVTVYLREDVLMDDKQKWKFVFSKPIDRESMLTTAEKIMRSTTNFYSDMLLKDISKSMEYGMKKAVRQVTKDNTKTVKFKRYGDLNNEENLHS